MPIFVMAVFFSALLLFSVQPMVAKFILPSFGGTAAVWATCMVVFQTLLLAGYTYAHLLRAKLSPKQQRWTHLAVLLGALLLLPPIPQVNPTAAVAHPVWELLRCVLGAVGLPFFALAATAPLVMEWFRQAFPARTPDRLYAFSNAGSLVALLSYPALIEPKLGGKLQAFSWAGGMGLFVVICAITAWWSERQRQSAPESTTQLDEEARRTSSSLRPPSPQSGEGTSPVQAARVNNARVKAPMWLWVALSACGSGLLLALTNQITQDVAPMPLLWVAPLGVYLLTFVLCFESTRFYRRWLFMPACFVLFLWLAWLLQEGYRQGFWVQIGGYLSVLFCACMLCHGELYRLRPPPERLTAFYLSLSLGGALGGMFVALLAPLLFPMILETPILVISIALLVIVILKREQFRWSLRVSPITVAVFMTLCISVSLGFALAELRRDSIYLARNFYGVYRVKESPTLLLDGIDYPLIHGPVRVFLSGQIYHGLQFTSPDAQTNATSYYCEEGGLATVLKELSTQTNRHLGIVGLGAGAFAVHGQPGDRLRFYELNPEVLSIARSYFTFLTNSLAPVEVVLGDGRLALEHEPPQGFDLLLLDAFTGDSVPTHLLTDEALSVYQKHLKSNGVLIFNISNLHLDLRPVLQAAAEKHGLTAVALPPRRVDAREGKLPSAWMMITTNRYLLRQPAIREMIQSDYNSVKPKPLLWTDDHSSILPILH